MNVNDPHDLRDAKSFHFAEHGRVPRVLAQLGGELWLPPDDDWTANGFGIAIPSRPPKRYSIPTGISLFAGIGGFDMGFINAGFHVVAANEWDAIASLTYMVNLARWGQYEIHYVAPDDETRLEKELQRQAKHGSVRKQIARDGWTRELMAGTGWISHYPHVPGVEHFFFGDGRQLTGKRMLDTIGVGVGEIDCVMGGPPCQGFSTANNKRTRFDPRNDLTFEFVRMVLEIRPKTMIMENVPAIAKMLTPDGVPVIDALCRVLEDGGWGTYDALRQALHVSAGAGAALRGKIRGKAAKKAEKKARRAEPIPPDDAAEDDYVGTQQQLGLFDDMRVPA